MSFITLLAQVLGIIAVFSILALVFYCMYYMIRNVADTSALEITYNSRFPSESNDEGEYITDVDPPQKQSKREMSRKEMSKKKQMKEEPNIIEEEISKSNKGNIKGKTPTCPYALKLTDKETGDFMGYIKNGNLTLTNNIGLCKKFTSDPLKTHNHIKSSLNNFFNNYPKESPAGMEILYNMYRKNVWGKYDDVDQIHIDFEPIPKDSATMGAKALQEYYGV